MNAIDAARAALASYDDEEGDVLGLAMRSQLYDHGAPTATVIVLLHGLTASPPAFDGLARELHELGHTVIVPRVVRHGHVDRMTETLSDLSAEELRDFGERIVAIASTLGADVRVLGHSLGGLLALWVAQRYAIERAIAVAPFLGVRFVPHELHRAVVPVVRRLPNRFVFWNPLLRENLMPEHGYPRFATHAICSALEIADGLRAEANRKAPRARAVEIVINASEISVSNRAARGLVRGWRSAGAPCVRLHRLRGLPPSHDVIEPYRGFGDRVYPTLIALANEVTVPDR